MSEIEEVVQAQLKLLLVDQNELLDAVERLPIEIKNKGEEVVALVEAMKKAIATVPSELDASFNSKVNKVLDIVQEIDKHTDILERMLDRKIPKLLDDHAELIKRQVKPPYFLIFMVGVLGSLFGGAIVFAALILS